MIILFNRQFYQGLLVSIALTWACLSYAENTATPIEYHFQGIRGPALQNITARLDNLPKPLTPQKSADLLIDQIRLALQPYGYFKPQIKYQIKKQADKWHIDYQITPGPALTISASRIQIIGPGANNAKFKQWLKHYPLPKGQVLLTEEYTQAKQQLLLLAEQAGYLKAQFQKHSIQVDLARNTANIELIFATGPRYSFGKIHFSSTPLSERFLQRYVHFQPGQTYSTQAVLQLQDDLSNSNYFSEVSVIPERDDNQDLQVPIQVKLTPRKSQQYRFGIGYGTDTNIRGTLGWEWRRITPYGHHLAAEITASAVQSSIKAQYIIPGSNPVTDQYTINTSLQNYQYIQGESHTQQFGIGYLTGKDGWQRTLTLNYQQERFRFNDQTYRSSRLLIPSLTWQYTKSDKPINPSRGYRVSLNIQGAEKTLLSDTRFIQSEIQGKCIQPLSDASRLILRADLGYTSVQDLHSLPLSLRFFAGGSQSIRGYKYQELGPGRYLNVASIEYQHRIKGNWNWAVFYDLGNALNNWQTPDPPYSGLFQQGAGIGMVWHAPIGALELSLAKALSKQGQPIQIQFSMGPEL